MCISCVSFCKWICDDEVEEESRNAQPAMRVITVRAREDLAPATARSNKNLSPIPEALRALEDSNPTLSELSNAAGPYLTPRITPRSFNVVSAPADSENLVAESISGEKTDQNTAIPAIE